MEVEDGDITYDLVPNGCVLVPSLSQYAAKAPYDFAFKISVYTCF